MNFANHAVQAPTIKHRRMFTLAAAAFAAVLLAACNSKPGASDIEPYIMNGVGRCPLWTISDFKKVDGVPQGDVYQVEFAAKLTFKQEHAKAKEEFHSHANTQTADGDYEYCMSQQALRALELGTAQEYSVSGVLPMVKSENGWRLNEQLYQIDMKIEPR